MADMEAHLNTFRVKATETMKRAAEFEIEMKIDKLMRAMHHCAYDLVNIHTIMQMDAENWNVGFTKKEIAGHASVRLYNQQLPPSFYERSGLVKDNITVSYVEDHLQKNLRALGDLEPPDDGTQLRDEELINMITLSLLAIFPDLTVNLLTGEAPNAAKKRVSGFLT